MHPELFSSFAIIAGATTWGPRTLETKRAANHCSAVGGRRRRVGHPPSIFRAKVITRTRSIHRGWNLGLFRHFVEQTRPKKSGPSQFFAVGRTAGRGPGRGWGAQDGCRDKPQTTPDRRGREGICSVRTSGRANGRKLPIVRLQLGQSTGLAVSRVPLSQPSAAALAGWAGWELPAAGRMNLPLLPVPLRLGRRMRARLAEPVGR